MNNLPRHRTVSDVMTTAVHVASKQTPFKRLVELIEDNKVSAVPIVDEQGIPIGIVSESDLLLKERRRELETEPSLLHARQRRQERAKAEGVVAVEIMTKPPITVRADTTLPQAARQMQERNVRRLVVVDERGKIAGMDAKGADTVIKAQVPMAEMLTYEQQLTSHTGGRGAYHMEFSHYDEVPAHLLPKIIAASKAERGEVKAEEE